MYISPKYKFIFLRVPKVASSSICDFFAENIDDANAIYTPIDDTKKSVKNVPRIIFNKYNKFSWAHLTLQNIIDENLIKKEEIDEYKKIAFIRNPFDRQLSLYYHFKKRNELGLKKETKPSLLEYRSVAKNGYFEEINGKKRQSDFLKYNNKISGDYVLYENLNSYIENFMNNLEINIKYPLPNHKNDARPKIDDFYFEDEDKEKIINYFKEDFEIYNRLKYESLYSEN